MRTQRAAAVIVGIVLGLGASFAALKRRENGVDAGVVEDTVTQPVEDKHASLHLVALMTEAGTKEASAEAVAQALCVEAADAGAAAVYQACLESQRKVLDHVALCQAGSTETSHFAARLQVDDEQLAKLVAFAPASGFTFVEDADDAAWEAWLASLAVVECGPVKP